MTSHQCSLCFLRRKVAPPTQPQRQQLAVTVPVQTVNQAESGMYKCRCTALCINIIIFAQQYQRWQPYHYTYILQSPVFIATLLFMIQPSCTFTQLWHGIFHSPRNQREMGTNGKPGFKASSSIANTAHFCPNGLHCENNIKDRKQYVYIVTAPDVEMNIVHISFIPSLCT